MNEIIEQSNPPSCLSIKKEKKSKDYYEPNEKIVFMREYFLPKKENVDSSLGNTVIE